MSLSTTDLIGQELSQGRYHVAAKLGEGGMGAVYRAVDTNLGKDVVIKVPHPMLLTDPQFAARFAREIRALVTLSHPHIVPIREVGEHEGLPFAVMEFLSGGSLDDRRPVDGSGQPKAIPPEQLSGWLADITKTLDFVHSEGYVHRDVKPGNILFDRHDTVYLGDFGIVKALQPAGGTRQSGALTGSGMVLGTADYMAPELCDGRPFDGRVDQYALAVTVYELLAGKTPFSATTPVAVLVKHLHDKPPLLHEVNPSVPRGLSQAVDRALSKSPEARYGSCGEFARAVLAASERRETGPISVSEIAGQTPPPLLPDALLPTVKVRAMWTNSVGMELIRIAAGKYQRGARDGEIGAAANEKPRHWVLISREFAVGKCPVTQGVYTKVMGHNPSHFSSGGRRSSDVRGMDTTDFPVEYVSWFDTIEFCNKLSVLERLSPYYELSNVQRSGQSITSATVNMLGGNGYRLLTEAEWEYVTRAGTETIFPWGNSLSSSQANFDGKRPYGGTATGLCLHRTTKVGSYQPNAWGLYDTAGNVYEWVWDVYNNDEYQQFASKTAINPTGGPSTDASRVLRGGSWSLYGLYCRSAARGRGWPEFRFYGYGFRVAQGQSSE